MSIRRRLVRLERTRDAATCSCGLDLVWVQEDQLMPRSAADHRSRSIAIKPDQPVPPLRPCDLCGRARDLVIIRPADPSVNYAPERW